MSRFIRVAVPVPLHRLFTYRLHDEQPDIGPGVRVTVPFGPRKLLGIVVEGPSDTAWDIEPSKVRPIIAVLDQEPSLDPQLLALCHWMAAYYHTPPGDAYLLPLPPGLSSARLAKPTQAVFKMERVVRWVKSAEPGARLGKKMEAALAWLEVNVEASCAEVRSATGANLDTLGRLAAKGLVMLDERQANRDPFDAPATGNATPPEPTDDQCAAIERLSAHLDRYSGTLLMGVTGSGKTEVYLRLIDRVLAKGRGALVLVPEIALTPQLVGVFRGRLGDQVAVLHSGLSAAARTEQWVRIRRGELRVVIGARSALFAPIHDLGLIVIDEEHEGSFKQDTAPRYHARDLALVRGREADCPVVLGSATPSLESWTNVSKGKLELVRLSSRVLDRPLPEVSLVDMRTARPVDEDGLISEALFEQMKANLAQGQQTILFVNRRGFAAFMVCRDCGEALTCPSCSVTYTWHRRRQRLTCHWCGHEVNLPSSCPSCDADALQDVGFGTERLEAVVKALLPGARVARMDRDTTRGKALPRLLDAFRARDVDILVGTQMVAKGHDFPGVTLVGVMLAELGLRLPDFRASERTFQLLTQIAGRAGRAEQPGRVLIQSFVPEHYALQRASRHDAEGFLESEKEIREALDYPPYGQLALFRISSPERQHAEVEAERLRQRLMHQDSQRVVRLQGPMLAPVERARGRWRYQLLCRARSRSALGAVLTLVQAELAESPPPSSVHITLDVDPVTFM